MTIYSSTYIITNVLFVYAIYLLFHTFFGEDTHSKKQEYLTYSLYYIVSSLLIYVERIPYLVMIVNIIFISLLSLCYKGSLQRKLIAISFIYSFLLVIEVLVAVGIGYIDVSIIQKSTFDSIVGLILIRLITLILAYALRRYHKISNEILQIPRYYYFLFIFILFGSIFLFISSLENQELTLHNVVICGAVLVMINLTMIFMDKKVYQSIILSHEKDILFEKNNAYEEQADIINQSTESIRLLKHDIKNHLLMVQELYRHGKEDEASEYITKTLGEIEKNTFSQSNNFIIDSIVNFKLSMLHDVSAKISVDVYAPPNMSIAAHDITNILGNLLDNAIAGMKESKEKFINLQINCRLGNLIILLDNSFDGIANVEHGQFKTRKAEKENHGLGLSSVRKTLEKYNGELNIEYTKDMFSVSVVIPYEN